MNEIGKVLEQIYDPSLVPPPPAETPSGSGAHAEGPLLPFAKVDGIAPESPAAEAVRGSLLPLGCFIDQAASQGLRREDLIVKFGHLMKTSFSASSLQPLAELVGSNEKCQAGYNHLIPDVALIDKKLQRELHVQILRDGQELSLRFTPRKGWGGRGMLGCAHLAFSVILVTYPSPSPAAISCPIMMLHPSLFFAMLRKRNSSIDLNICVPPWKWHIVLVVIYNG
jgi:hypothetical protein